MNNICQQLQGTTSSKMEAATALPAYGAPRLYCHYKEQPKIFTSCCKATLLQELKQDEFSHYGDGFSVERSPFHLDQWPDLTWAQVMWWDGTDKKRHARFPIFEHRDGFAALHWEPASTLQPAPGLRNMHILFHSVDQHPLLSQTCVIITYYKTYYKEQQELSELTNSMLSIKHWTLLCHLLCLLLSKATSMQTLGHSLNFSITSYFLLLNGVLYKALFHLVRISQTQSLKRLLGEGA